MSISNDLVPAATSQEFFDRSVARLRDGRGQAVHDYACCYRHPTTGLACVAGSQIPDMFYREAFEGTNILDVLQEEPQLRPYFPNTGLAYDLQKIHDIPSCWNHARFTDEGERQLKYLALAHGLTYTPPNTQVVP